MHRPNRGARVELDFAEGAFVVGDVLLEQRHERLRLLRAQINSLEVMKFDLRFRALLHGAEDEKEIPDIDADLHAVGVRLAVFGRLNELNIGLILRIHERKFTLGGADGAKKGERPDGKRLVPTRLHQNKP